MKYLKGNATNKENFNIIPLRDIATFTSGYSYNSNELINSNWGLITIKCFNKNIGFKLDGFKGLSTRNTVKKEQIAEKYEIVIAHTDLTQNADIIGNAEIILNKNNYEKLIASMDLVILRPMSVNKFLLYMLVHNPDFKKFSLGYCSGTTVLHLSKRALNEYLVYLPKDENITNKISCIVETIINKQAILIEQNLKLNRLKQLYLKKFFN